MEQDKEIIQKLLLKLDDEISNIQSNLDKQSITKKIIENEQIKLIKLNLLKKEMQNQIKTKKKRYNLIRDYFPEYDPILNIINHFVFKEY
jgi:hypothetical protein